MATEQSRDKAINSVLAELLSRALTYAKCAKSKTRSQRERAVWRALADETQRQYNFALYRLGIFGTSKIAVEQRSLMNQYVAGKYIEQMTQEEIEEIIVLAFGVSESERDEFKQKIAREKLQAKVLTYNYPPVIKDAIMTLAKHGKLGELINVDGYIDKTHDKLPEYENIPRGNPTKGGLVSKYLALGKTHQEATRLANQDLGLKFSDVNEPDFDDEIAKALAQVEAEEPTAQEKESAKGKALLDLLKPMNDSDFDSEEV
jgi:hypothetical protein